MHSLREQWVSGDIDECLAALLEEFSSGLLFLFSLSLMITVFRFASDGYSFSPSVC